MRRSLPLIALTAALVCPHPPVAAAPGQDEYVFVPDTKRLVALQRNDYETVGRLDETGFFTPERSYQVVRGGRATSGVEIDLLNTSPGTAYEYRSGRLILGEIDRKGNFVPGLGTKVIAFEQYKPGGNAPPIYNLPGRFVKKEEKKDNGRP
jgi:hypothetical protein